MYQKYLKRILDILLSGTAIVVTLPMMLVIAILVKVKLGSPIIFKQERPGLYGEIFVLYKFRTMNNKVDEDGNLLPNKLRLTKFGKLLRSTSLDELPELFNIFIGDMSFIGPRPLLKEYLPKYSREQMQRHNVRPGLTGYTAVNGRASLDWNEKLKLDVWYVRNVNILLDLKIFIKTFLTVAKRENISSDRGKFSGNRDNSYELKERIKVK